MNLAVRVRSRVGELQRDGVIVVKLIRVHGGCSGAKNRRRTLRGCDKPRGAAKQAMIRGFPNGETLHVEDMETCTEYIGVRGERGELKHLSNPRKRKKPRFRQ